MLTMGHLNGHLGLWSFVHGTKAGGSRRHIAPAAQSVFGMRSVSFFIPVYAETVAYTPADLKKDGNLQHLIALYPGEWANFCERAFCGAAPDAVAAAFFAPGRALAQLFLEHRATFMDKIWGRLRAWPPKPGAKGWSAKVSEYAMDIGLCFFNRDPPPVIPPTWPAEALDEDLLNQLEFWCQQQVRERRWRGGGRGCGAGACGCSGVACG